MPLNLVLDRWIPVRRTDGGTEQIRPDEITRPDIAFPDWPRADLNIACLELLVGLVFLADPPADNEEWRARRAPAPERLRERFAALAPAFDLIGDGPRFLQDFAPLDGDGNPPDMLFIDSAGGQTARNNADLLVRRNRYPDLDLPLAAMALYTLQAHAPSGGAGNRTSMRGGGPMVTLVDPGTGRLWDLVWANVPNGAPAGIDILPWMKPTRTSEAKGSEVWPVQIHPAEAFFGMPRRLRLVAAGDRVTGVIQRPYGINYAGHNHPLTPYYRLKTDSDWLPVHPRAGAFGYRNWLGVIVSAAVENATLARRAETIKSYEGRLLPKDRRGTSVIVAGYAMDNMKPRDFTWSRQPLLPLLPEIQKPVVAMIESAETFGSVLRGALKTVTGDGKRLELLRETFFIRTQSAFDQALAALLRGEDAIETAKRWVQAVRREAEAIFNDEALPGLDGKSIKEIEAIVAARGYLRAVLFGRAKPGPDVYTKLHLTAPGKKQGTP
ncbi:MAG: type I-E CRISPR-associated protein Cse1/CasA [Rhodospirillaceae bacterium]|nr:type I-E CRISPR-associated protein Cse1/CasA [Rhodospirillaceae bacterium]